MIEQYNPLGLVGLITAFNFPNAVFGWNTAIALICGNLVLWKGAESASLLTIATTKLVVKVLADNGFNSVVTLCQGWGKDIGEAITNDKRIPLVSFTGSCSIGKSISEKVHSRFGKTLLELGGNNAAVVMDDADIGLCLKSSCFGAVGTAGQRCTSLRRLYIHESLYEKFVDSLVKAYSTVKPGNPLDEGTLMGPLHNKAAVDRYLEGVERIQ
jgi:aldehyde dehydrogenase family 7 protein A1